MWVGVSPLDKTQCWQRENQSHTAENGSLLHKFLIANIQCLPNCYNLCGLQKNRLTCITQCVPSYTPLCMPGHHKHVTSKGLCHVHHQMGCLHPSMVSDLPRKPYIRGTRYIYTGCNIVLQSQSHSICRLL